jgi:two-component system, OmpR family, response regulator NblR
MGTSTADQSSHILLIGANEGQTRQMEFDLHEAGYTPVVAPSPKGGVALCIRITPQ